MTHDLKGYVKRLSRSEFVRNFLTLLSGASLAQALALAFSPILSRLYGPHEFGVFDVYLSVAGIITGIASLRYEQAVMLPKNHKESADLLVLSYAAIATTTALVAIALLFINNHLLARVISAEVVACKWWIPLAILLAGAGTATEAWSARTKQFGVISISRVFRVLVTITVQCVGAALRWGPLGLIAGSVAGQTGSFAILSGAMRRSGISWRERVAARSLKRVAVEYADFPRYDAPQTVLNTASQNMPVLLLNYFFGTATAGLYGMAARAIQLPSLLILSSLRQVLYQKCSEAHHHGRDTFEIFKKSTLGLVAVVSLPSAAILLAGPTIFSIVLGPNWAESGEYARWITLWLAARFINPPAIIFAQVNRLQRTLLIQQIAVFIGRAASLIIGGLAGSPLLAVALFGVFGMVCNVAIVIWMWLFLMSSRQKREHGAS